LETSEITTEGQSSNIKTKKYNLETLPETLDKQKLNFTREFARMIISTQKCRHSWKKRQPWLLFNEEFNYLKNWAHRYNQWWQEMAKDCWQSFGYDDEQIIDTYQMSALISQHLQNDTAQNVGDIIKSLNSLIENSKEV
jgi:hypothetical protein